MAAILLAVSLFVGTMSDVLAHLGTNGLDPLVAGEICHSPSANDAEPGSDRRGSLHDCCGYCQVGREATLVPPSAELAPPSRTPSTVAYAITPPDGRSGSIPAFYSARAPPLA